MPIRDAVTQVDGWYNATVVEGGQDVQNCKSAISNNIYPIDNMSDEISQNH